MILKLSMYVDRETVGVRQKNSETKQYSFLLGKRSSRYEMGVFEF